jgi:hypothetical protein
VKKIKYENRRRAINENGVSVSAKASASAKWRRKNRKKRKLAYHGEKIGGGEIMKPSKKRKAKSGVKK